MTKAILAGASAIALLAISNGASASVLDSGGGTLAAKLYRDIFNCYATTAKTTTAYTTDFFSTSASSTYYAAAYGTSYIAGDLNYPKTLPSACSSAYFNPAHTDTIDYLPVGSGAGQAAFVADTATWGLPAAANPVAWLNAHIGITTLTAAEAEFDFSGSDAGLSSTQVSSAAVHGTVLQFPGLLTPIDLSTNTSSGTTKVKLTVAEICGIFGGTITEWSSVTGGGSGAGNNTGAITVVVRADSSGTSYIFSNYLAQVCPTVGSYPGFSAANGFPSTKPSWSAAAVANGGTFAGFVSESGSGGVASEIESTPDSINYISPDYVGKANGYSLTAAAEVEYPNSKYPTGTPSFVAPSSSGITKLAQNIPAPTDGGPLDWGQSLNDAILAQDKAYSTYPKGAYPIGGFTFLVTYACPANPTAVSNLFTWYYDNATDQGYPFIAKMLSERVFAAVPTSFLSSLNSNVISQINSGC